jgi:hypothetical protein
MPENKTKNQANSEKIDDLELETSSQESVIAESVEDEEKQEINDEIIEEENITIPKAKMLLVKKLILNIKENNDQLLQMLSSLVSKEEEERIGLAQLGDDAFSAKAETEDLAGGRIIEGVFDGENMIGPDGKQYSVPANYASKSKLLEGDTMKLTITPNGTFIYKQIGPIDRIRLVGELEQGQPGNFLVQVEGKKYKVLTASVTYYKGQVGDEVVILVPKSGESAWAAVENIVRKVN